MCGTELITAVNNGNFKSKFGQMQSFGNRCITAAHNRHFLVVEESTVTDCAIRDTSAGQSAFPFNSQFSPDCAAGQNNRFTGKITFGGFNDFQGSL